MLGQLKDSNKAHLLLYQASAFPLDPSWVSYVKVSTGSSWDPRECRLQGPPNHRGIVPEKAGTARMEVTPIEGVVRSVS